MRFLNCSTSSQGSDVLIRAKPACKFTITPDMPLTLNDLITAPTHP